MAGRRSSAWSRPGGKGRVTTIEDEPHPSRRGWLRNHNPPGDFRNAARCGAKTRRQTRCQGPAMPNGRCRMHGGASTGPRTFEGLERSRRARWRHGTYSRAARAQRAQSRRYWRELWALVGQLNLRECVPPGD
ncbi:MAG: HGGxSTG domain-containing protein [Vicinamibacterales bacterium]